MKKKPDPYLTDDENPEWTRDDFRKAMTFSEMQEVVKRHFRGKQKKPLKVPTTIRLDEDVITALRATGKGWQTRLNDMAREWLKQQKVA